MEIGNPAVIRAVAFFLDCKARATAAALSSHPKNLKPASWFNSIFECVDLDRIPNSLSCFLEELALHITQAIQSCNLQLTGRILEVLNYCSVQIL